MTDDILLKATKLKENIKELKSFLFCLERTDCKAKIKFKNKILSLVRVNYYSEIEFKSLTEPQQAELYSLIVRWKEEAEEEFNNLGNIPFER